MPGKKKETAEELEKELKILKEENLRLTVENQYLKKIECLGFGKRKTSKEEIAAVITELRHELKA